MSEHIRALIVDDHTIVRSGLRLLLEAECGIQVLVLTMHRSDEYFFEMLKAGASGYILKGAETSDLINAVRVVGRGEVFLYTIMAQKLVKDYLNFVQWGEETGSSLSPREKEILTLLAEGYSNKEIAEKL